MKKNSDQVSLLTGRIKMKELALLSGISKATIYHYLKLGILHPPDKLGLSFAVYNTKHLATLKRIRDLRENKKIPLRKIKELVKHDKLDPISPSQEENVKLLIDSLEEKKRKALVKKSEQKKNEILDAAIALFSKKGYETTTIEDIADSLHMAKGTVYLHFKNKEKLFLQCMERLMVIAVPEKVWDDIRNEKNNLKRMQKRGYEFQKAFPTYKGILTMTRAALGSDNQKLSEKAVTILQLMTQPIVKDLDKGIEEGIFREIDKKIISHLMLAMGEGLGSFLMMNPECTLDRGFGIMYDFILNGINKSGSEKIPENKSALPAGELTDIKGIKTFIKNMLFGEKGYLSVKIGEGTAKLDPGKIKKITFKQQQSILNVDIVTTEENIINAECDNSIYITGETIYGNFTIQINNVEQILFIESKD